MNERIQLDPDDLRDQGARLVDRVGQTYSRLHGCLARAERRWGDDDWGHAFARNFTPHADQPLAGLRAMEDSLDGVASGITNAAKQFESQDLSGAGAMDLRLEALRRGTLGEVVRGYRQWRAESTGGTAESGGFDEEGASAQAKALHTALVGRPGGR
ncbi:hypothetical protein [Nocardia thraciensis]